MPEEETRKPFRFPGSSGRTVPAAPVKTWKVLIADDDEEVHVVTRLVLKGKQALGRSLDLISAKDSTQCRAALVADPDIAVVLLDVVMDTDDAGLVLARWIRTELGNASVRIILRTGQPGRAPESRVITEYEINDYKEKTELTHEKLWSSVVTAIRGYRDIKTIQQSRAGMQMILRAAPELFKLRSLKLFASGVLTQMISLLNSGKDAALLDVSGFAAAVDDHRLKILAGAGKYLDLAEADLPGRIGDPGLDLLHDITDSGGMEVRDGRMAACVTGLRGERSVIYIEECGELSDLDRELLSLYCTNVSAAYMNMGLYTELEDRLDEKSALVHEIHHRVKNNLQVILSLISLSDRTAPGQALEGVRRLIAAMAVVHDRVSESPNEERIDFESCAVELAADVAADASDDKTVPDVRVESRGFILPLEKAVPCSLLIVELLSYVLAPRPWTGPVALRLDGDQSGRRTVLVTVPGKGRAGAGDELELARNLAAQLGGSLRESRDDTGSSLFVEFSA